MPEYDLIETLAQRFQSLVSKGTPWPSLPERRKDNWRTTARECLRQMRWIAARAADFQSAKRYGDVDAMSGKLSLAPEGWEAPEDWFPLP